MNLEGVDADYGTVDFVELFDVELVLTIQIHVKIDFIPVVC